jgi:hypothetical protein
MALMSNCQLMKKVAGLAAAAALVLVSASAFAEAGKNDASKGEHGSEGPSSPAESSPASSTEAGPGQTTDISRQTDSALANGPYLSLPRFKFEAGWELHSMLVQNNLVGNGAETVFNYFYGAITYYLTPHDRIGFTAGLYQFALADPGESGWRADDLLLRYTHHFALPFEVGLDVSGSVTAPTSFASQKMGLVTEPQVRILIDRTFAKYLTVDLRLYNDFYWETYTTVQGGSTPNPITRTGGVISAEVQFPWHTALVFGADLATAYTTYYGPAGQPASGTGIPGATGTVGSNGIETNPTYTSQPLQQDYGIDVYVRYDMKRIYGVASSLTLSYAQGDPTSGYTSDLIDGVQNLYLLYPEASQIFLSLALKY